MALQFCLCFVSNGFLASIGTYRVVQLDFAPEIEVFYMLFERHLSIFSLTSLKQHIEYVNFQCKSSWTSLYKDSRVHTNSRVKEIWMELIVVV